MKFLLVLAAVLLPSYALHKGFRLHERALSPRVVGGEDAIIGDFPHQVSVQWGFIIFFQHVCGGTIISDKWILTAGHCKTEVPDGDFIIVGGIINLTDQGQSRKVINIIVHEDYNGGVNPNDIALMELERSFEFNPDISPAKLPAAGAIPSGDALLSGWGSISTGNFPIMPTELKKATLPILTYEECADALVKLAGTSEPLAETNLCTGPLEGGRGACSGDSGGPLTSSDRTVIGVVSWGFIPCGTVGAPSVFTQVSSFVDWINQNIKK